MYATKTACAFFFLLLLLLFDSSNKLRTHLNLYHILFTYLKTLSSSRHRGMETFVSLSLPPSIYLYTKLIQFRLLNEDLLCFSFAFRFFFFFFFSLINVYYLIKNRWIQLNTWNWIFYRLNKINTNVGLWVLLIAAELCCRFLCGMKLLRLRISEYIFIKIDGIELRVVAFECEFEKKNNNECVCAHRAHANVRKWS